MEDKEKHKVSYRDANTWDIPEIAHMWYKMMDEIAIPELRLIADGNEKERFFYEIARRIYMITNNDPQSVYKVIIAVHHGMPCGFVLGDLRQLEYSVLWTGHCEALYVKKQLRHMKIGPTLIKMITDWFKSRGAQREQFQTIYNVKLSEEWTKRGYKPIQILYRKEL